MRRHDDQFLSRIKLRPIGSPQRPFFQRTLDVKHRVDSRITRHVDTGAIDAFGFQIVRGAFGGREVDVRHARRKHAVHFLREGPLGVPGAQASLYVSERDPEIERRESPAERGRGVALHQHHIRPLRRDHRLERGHHPRCRFSERLPATHHVQIMVGSDPEGLEDLVQHLAMLPGHA